MRHLMQAGFLLASALAKPALSQGSIPSAFVALQLPATAQDTGLPLLSLLRLDVIESAAACGALPSITINGAALSSDGQQVVSLLSLNSTHNNESSDSSSNSNNSGAGEVVLRWDADCVSWGGQDREQRLRLRVESVRGIKAVPADDERDSVVVRFRQTHPARILDIEGAASAVRFHANSTDASEPVKSAEDTSSPTATSTLFDKFSGGFRKVYTYLTDRPAAKTADPVLQPYLHPEEWEAPPSACDAAACSVVNDIPQGKNSLDGYIVRLEVHSVSDLSADGASSSSPHSMLKVLAIVYFLFFFIVYAHRWYLHRRAQRQADRQRPLDGDDDVNGGLFAAFRTLPGRMERRRARREAWRQHRARIGASFRAAAVHVRQRVEWWKQTCGEKSTPTDTLFVSEDISLPVGCGSSSSRRSSSERYSMEDEIAQFRAAADIVSQMISAEEGRSTTVVDTRPQRWEQNKPQTMPPPPPPRHLDGDDSDDAESAPPAYSSEDYVHSAEAYVVANGFRPSR